MTNKPAIPDQVANREREAANGGLPPLRRDYRRYYGHWHDESDGHFENMTQYFATKVASFMDTTGDPRILEVGCGWGFCLGGLRKLGMSRVEGFDTDPGAVAIAQRRSLPATLLALSEVSSFMAARAGQYDAVLAFDVLEHVPLDEQMPFLRSVLSVLKPGGFFLCQVPNANSLIASRFRYNDWTHHTMFTEHSLDFALFSAGFEDIRVMDAEPDARPSLRRVGEVAWWSLRRTLRGARRLSYMAELGRKEGGSVPLSPNIIATAHR